jgi:Mg-chelatase subunit ChlD
MTFIRSLDHPLALVLFPLSIALLHRAAPFGKGVRSRGFFFLRASALAAITLAIAGWRLPMPGGAVYRIWLLDRSGSVRHLAWMPDEAILKQGLRGGDHLGVLAFAQNPAWLQEPVRISDFHVDSLFPTGRGHLPAGQAGGEGKGTRGGDGKDEEGTDLERAVREALARVPDDARAHLVVATDGIETAGNFDRWVESIRRRGVRVDFVALDRFPSLDARILSIEAPRRLGPGRGATARAACYATREAEGELFLSVHGEGGRVLGEGLRRLPVSLPSGEPRAFAFDLPDYSEEAGPLFLEFCLKVDGDLVPENDRRAGVIDREEDRPVLLYLTEDGQERGLQKLLSQGYRVVRASPASLREAGDWPAAALVVLDEVDERRFPKEARLHLRRLVEEQGAGFLALGGNLGYGAGGYAKTSIEEMLPVWALPREESPLALALVLDRSGSMGEALGGVRKIDAARAAAERLFGELVPADEVALLFFNHEAELAVPLARWEEGEKRAREMVRDRYREGGGTRIARALEQALGLLEGRPARPPAGRRQILLLSDGVAEEEEAEELSRLREFARRAEAARIGVSAVGIQPRPGRREETIFEAITAGGRLGKFHKVERLEALPDLFIAELREARRASLVREGAFSVAEGTGAGELPEEFRGRLPGISRYCRTVPKPGVEPVLVCAEHMQEPILTLGTAGLGRVGAFASSPALGGGEGGGQSWLRGKTAVRFWSWLSDRLAGPSVARGGEEEQWTGRFMRDVVGDWHYLLDLPSDSLSPELRIIDAAGASHRFPLRSDSLAPVGGEGGVRGDDREQRRLVAGPIRIPYGFFQAALVADDGAAGQAGGGAHRRWHGAMAPDMEWEIFGARRRTLEDWADRLGGRVFDPQELGKNSILSPVYLENCILSPVYPWLAGWVVGMILIEYAWRGLAPDRPR